MEIEKHKKDAFSNSVDYLESIIALMPGHVYWKDKNGVFLGCNDAQAKYIGLQSRHDVVGLTAYDTLPKDFADEVTRYDQDVMASGVPMMMEEILTLDDGTETIWLSKKVPLYDKQNQIIGILGISFDITDQKKTQQELQETQHKLAGMTLVSSSIAHELRTPLATFGIATDGVKAVFPALKQAYLWAKEQKAPLLTSLNVNYLNGIEKSLASMSNEVRDAFTFIDIALLNSTPDLDKGNPETFSISTCIEEALSRYPFQGKRNLVHWNKDPQTDFPVNGDKLLVIHVLFNLLKNALYYVAAASKGDIQIWLEKGAVNKLFFKDTGTGIDSDVLPHIFERFFSRTYHGAGIGLTFCKNVMESLGGTISCESVKQDYTLFVLSFPE